MATGDDSLHGEPVPRSKDTSFDAPAEAAPEDTRERRVTHRASRATWAPIGASRPSPPRSSIGARDVVPGALSVVVEAHGPSVECASHPVSGHLPFPNISARRPTDPRVSRRGGGSVCRAVVLGRTGRSCSCAHASNASRRASRSGSRPGQRGAGAPQGGTRIPALYLQYYRHKQQRRG